MAERNLQDLLNVLGARNASEVTVGKILPSQRRPWQATIASISNGTIQPDGGGALRAREARVVGAMVKAVGPTGMVRSGIGFVEMIDWQRNLIAVSTRPEPSSNYGTPIGWCAGDSIYFDPEET